MDKELKMKVLEMMKKELKEMGVDSWGLFKVVFLVVAVSGGLYGWWLLIRAALGVFK